MSGRMGGMAAPVNPPRGMRDLLPAEKARRERALASSPSTAVVSETCCVWRKRSRPIVTSTTTATFSPTAAVCSVNVSRSMLIPKSVADHGTRRSIVRPMSGAIATPTMPTTPNSPITTLQNGRSVTLSARVWEWCSP